MPEYLHKEVFRHPIETPGQTHAGGDVIFRLALECFWIWMMSPATMIWICLSLKRINFLIVMRFCCSTLQYYFSNLSSLFVIHSSVSQGWRTRRACASKMLAFLSLPVNGPWNSFWALERRFPPKFFACMFPLIEVIDSIVIYCLAGQCLVFNL